MQCSVLGVCIADSRGALERVQVLKSDDLNCDYLCDFGNK